MWKPELETDENKANIGETLFISHLLSLGFASSNVLQTKTSSRPRPRATLFFKKLSTYFTTTSPIQSLQPLRRDKEAQVSHVSFSSCHLPMCCYCTEHWD